MQDFTHNSFITHTMLITISATLTEEQALILAKEKGWSDTTSQVIDSSVVPFVLETIPNTQTVGEFLSNVYQAMVGNDASRIYLEVFNRRIAEENEANREAIKEQIAWAMSSTVA